VVIVRIHVPLPSEGGDPQSQRSVSQLKTGRREGLEEEKQEQFRGCEVERSFYFFFFPELVWPGGPVRWKGCADGGRRRPTAFMFPGS
jgi:hypothetical protein